MTSGGGGGGAGRAGGASSADVSASSLKADGQKSATSDGTW